MAHLFIPDDTRSFNCDYGTLGNGVRCAVRFEPRTSPLICPDQTIPDLDERFIERAILVTSSGISSDFVVDGC